VKAIDKTVSSTTQTTPNPSEAADQRRLAKRYLKLRKRLNRLVAERDGRKAREVRSVVQLRWPEHALVRANRKLGKRIRRVRVDLRNKRAGLTPATRAALKQIAACESHGNPRAIGGGGAYRGKYQFSYGTWASVGGKGDPARASEAEQDRRAVMLLTRSGRGHWPVCG
jgi:Transglycosylase-like domain